MNKSYDSDYEKRKNAIKDKRKQRRKKRRIIFLKRLALFLSVTGIITLVVLCLTVFFPINKISVTGEPAGEIGYTQKEIIKASGISKGQNFFTAGKGAEEDITKNLPYILYVEIDKKFPETVNIKVTYAAETICYVFGSEFYVCDSDGKLLSIKKQKPENLTVVYGSTVKKTKTGENVTFKDEKISEVPDYISKKLSDAGITVNSVDVSNDMSIKVRINNSFDVVYGSSANFENKTTHLVQMLKSIEEGLVGTIDLSVWTKENPRGIFTQGA